MIDISDGLSSDLAHICKASGTGARVDQEMLPIEPLLSEFYSLAESLDLALNGGEDLGLLFTSPKKTFPMSDGVRITCIGEVTANIGIIELKASAYTSEIDPGGYRHF